MFAEFGQLALNVLEVIWPFLAGGGAAILGLWLKNKYDDKKYYPWVIAAVKFAEKTIPDNSKNKTLNKIDKFLQHFTESVEKYEGVEVTKALKAYALKAKEKALLELELLRDKDK